LSPSKSTLEKITMSQGTVLVTAATGFTGGATVEELLAHGRHVRALAHREDARSKRLQELGAEVVFGDFLDLDAIRAAVQGVQRAYLPTCGRRSSPSGCCTSRR
jgi:uncharacterized protein YbjT (DUF2867 family)